MTTPPDRPRRLWRGWLAASTLAALAGLALLLPACGWDGHFTILGYTTQPNYDTSIHTVRVPIFRSKLYWNVATIPGLEMDLTQAVVNAIEQRTPYKVKQENADTELLGTITTFSKATLNVLQFNYPREVETTMVVELIWRDLRTGEILTKPARRPGQPLPTDRAVPLLGSELAGPPGSPQIIMPSVPTLPSEASTANLPEPVPPGCGPDGKPIVPVVIRSVGHFIPELGQSLTTAQKENIDRMAIRVTEVMEKGW